MKRINGIIVVDKPQDFTSFDVIAKLRKVFETKSIGHGGTLDPMATGVLPLYVGKATKAVDLNPNQYKAYIATFKFGIKTDTGDITGEVLETSNGFPGEDEIKKMAEKFVGKISQIPPMYSAIKIGGKKLVDLARQGKTVERKPREIIIDSFDILEIDCVNKSITAEIGCSKGTYIRTLGEDFAESFGKKATLSDLRRTKSGGFCLKNCYTIEQIETAKLEDGLFEMVQSVETVFLGYNKIDLKPEQIKPYINGMTQRIDGENQLLRVYIDGQFHSLGEINDKKIKKVKSFEDFQ